MIGAVVRDNIVENVIVIDEKNVVAMEAALKCEIIDARPYGLTIGDLRTTAGWTRNAGGEQMILPLLDVETYDSYSVVTKNNIELQEQMTNMTSLIESESTEILMGEADE